MATLPFSDFVIFAPIPYRRSRAFPRAGSIVLLCGNPTPRQEEAAVSVLKSKHPIALNAAGLAVGALGGALFYWVGTPIPWLLGPLLTVAAVNISGWRITCPRGGRQLGQIFIGVVIGLYFSPTVAGIVLGQLPWMILAAVVTVGLAGVGAAIQTRVARVGLATGFLGSVPGGMAEMINLSDRLGGEPVAIVVSQLTRVTIVVITIPFALTYFGQAGSDIFKPSVLAVDRLYLLPLLAGAASVSFLLNRSGLTNAWMLGACAFTATLTALDIHLSAVPREFLTAAQVLIGVSIGQQFERRALAQTPRVILGSALTTVVMMSASVLLAAGIAAATGISIWSMIASTAPGGLAEMSVTAQALGLGVPLVTGYHVIRVFLITLMALPMFRMLEKAAGSRA